MKYMIDLTFKTEQGRFNCRAGAVIIHEGKVLLMRNPEEPYLYTVGGRIRFDETAAEAAERECLEETGIALKVQRLLVFEEQFYDFSVTGEHVHEFGLYFLMADHPDIEHASARSKTARGTGEELVWVELADLDRHRIVPEALAEQLKHLPENMIMITEIDSRGGKDNGD